MTRWLVGWSGMVLAGCLVISGCAPRSFITREDFEQARLSGSLLPPSMEGNYELGRDPLTDIGAPPPTVLSPDRPPRPMSLDEAIAIALENGTASGRGGFGSALANLGIYDTTMVNSPPIFGSSTGALTLQSDNLRVLALQPAIAGANIEAGLSRFDVNAISSVSWTGTDTLQQGLQSFSNGNSASWAFSLVKMLASGGFVSTTLQQNYQLLSNPPTAGFNIQNPLYSTSLILGFEQPLWRNRGVWINQLLGGTASPTTGIGIPGQVANQFAQRQSPALQAGGFVSNDGILIARLRFDQSRADFERQVQGLVLQVEVAYWNLFNAYGQLYSFEESLRISHRAWMIAHAQLQVGKATDVEYRPVKGQYEEFRGQRINAMGAVLEAERNLRGILGMPVEDGTRIVPITRASLTHYQPDWTSACHDALTLRPELVIARDNLRLAQYNLEVANNFLKPDVRLGMQYAPLGFGTTLSGRAEFADATGGMQPANALQSLASGHFANYTVGITANVPLGFQLEHAAVRAAQIALAQNYYLVKDQEARAKSYLNQQYAEMQKWYALINSRQAERIDYAKAVDAQIKKVLAGNKLFDVSFLDFQNKLADAQVKEYQAVAEYNNTLAKFEFARGTILRYNNVHIAEGQLPQAAQVRATEHEKARSKAIVLHERPDPLTNPGRLAHTDDVPRQEIPTEMPIFNRLPEVEPGPAAVKPDVRPGKETEVAPAPIATSPIKPAASVPPPAVIPPALSGPVASPVERTEESAPATRNLPMPSLPTPPWPPVTPAGRTMPPMSDAPIPLPALTPPSGTAPGAGNLVPGPR